MPLPRIATLHSCMVEHPMPPICMRAKYQKPIYSKDFWMQCYGKRRRFTHFPFFACTSLGMPTKRKGLQKGQAVWWSCILRVRGVETSRPMIIEVLHWREVHHSGTAKSLEIQSQCTI